MYDFHKDGLDSLGPKDLVAIVEVNTDLLANAANALDNAAERRHENLMGTMTVLIILSVVNTIAIGVMLYWLITGGL